MEFIITLAFTILMERSQRKCSLTYHFAAWPYILQQRTPFTSVRRSCIDLFSRVIDVEIRVYSLVDRHRRRYRRCYPMI